MIPRILSALLILYMASPSRAQSLDLVIRNGSVLDGSGSPAQEVDIGIRGDRVVLIGKNLRQKARRVIDAHGLVVAPGFIDPHTHTFEDLSNPVTSRNDAYLMQGVTTVATGNDGSSPLQIADALHKWAQQGIGTNAALFIGQGSVRSAVMGMSDAKPTSEQMDSMKSLVDRGMKDGAIGMSTGLYYAPGSYSSTEEVIALAKVAAADGGIYDTHMRDESTYNIGLLASVRETIRIGREAQMPVMISHIKALGRDVWGQSSQVIALVDEARAAGVRVTASRIPLRCVGNQRRSCTDTTVGGGWGLGCIVAADWRFSGEATPDGGDAEESRPSRRPRVFAYDCVAGQRVYRQDFGQYRAGTRYLAD